MVKEKYFYIGTKKEMDGISRIIDFGEDVALKNKFNILLPRYKKIVNDILTTLLNKGDFFGYNLQKFLEAYKSATPSVAQFKLSSQLAKDFDYLENVFSDKTSKDIDNQLSYAKKTTFLQEDTDLEKYIKAICDYLLVDIDLLIKGIGKIYDFKDDWFEKYIKDEEFHKLANKNLKKTWNSKLRIAEYEEYMVDQGGLLEGQSILEEKWAVMVYSGAFLALKKDKSKQNEVNAIIRLINLLYAQQLSDGKMPFSNIDAE